MRLLRNDWLHHNGQAIMSIDVQPGSKRVATCGQGSDNGGLVVIWNFEAAISTVDNSNMPKCLSRMENHLGCVNCVRWSYSGQMLASAGDDRFVMIWKYHGQATGHSSISSGTTNVEQWKCAYILRGHSLDVCHVAWSRGDRFLASCSMDNTIIVYNALKFPDVVATLKGHDGLIKGVAWDPLGKYLASQADDKSLKVWETSTWTCVKTIKTPFEGVSGTTYVLRLDWSPDGNNIVSAHAMNCNAPVSKVIERQNLSATADMAGHRKAITCVRFAPCIVQKGEKPKPACICALGSKDKTVSVWKSGCKRPLIIMQSMFNNTVMDISWSDDVLCLAACSYDGTAVFAVFERSEVGTPLSTEETGKYMMQLYGQIPKSLQNGHGESESLEIIESPDVFKARQQLQDTQAAVERSKDVLESSRSCATFSAKENAEPTIVEKASLTPSASVPAIESEVRNSDAKSDLPQATRPLQTVKVLADGRKRITPMMLLSASPSFSRPSDSEPSVTTLSPTVRRPESSEASMSAADVGAQTPGAESAVPHGVKRSAPSSDGVSAKRANAAADRGLYEVVEKHADSWADGASQPSTSNLEAWGFCVRLPTPMKRSSLTIEATVPLRGNSSICVENDIAVGQSIVVHRVRCSSKGAVQWETLLDAAALTAAASSRIVCFGCLNQTLCVLSLASGSSLRRGVVLDSVPVILSCLDWSVLVITSRGTITAWCFKDCSGKVLLRTTLHPILPDATVTVTGAWLTEYSSLVVSLSNGRLFGFTSKDNWIEICGASSNLCKLSSIVEHQPVNGPLATLIQQTRLNVETAKDCPDELSTLATLCHLENQLQAALLLNSPVEYKHWLHRYVTFLVHEGLGVRLKEVCDFLLGPIYKNATAADLFILGLEKRQLLSELLPIIACSSAFQRLFGEYSEELNAVRQTGLDL